MTEMIMNLNLSGAQDLNFDGLLPRSSPPFRHER